MSSIPNRSGATVGEDRRRKISWKGERNSLTILELGQVQPPLHYHHHHCHQHHQRNGVAMLELGQVQPPSSPLQKIQRDHFSSFEVVHLVLLSHISWNCLTVVELCKVHFGFKTGQRFLRKLTVHILHHGAYCNNTLPRRGMYWKIRPYLIFVTNATNIFV